MAGPDWPLMSKLRSGLALKLAVCLVGSTAGFFGVGGYLNLKLQRRNYEALILASADRVSDIILRSTRHEMLQNDRQSMKVHIRDMGSEQGIKRIRIFNKDGI